jgi:hypothetical protein
MAKKEDKGAAEGGAPAAAPGGIRLVGHPRARRHIALAKGWGGLLAFLVCFYLSHQAGLPASDAIWRAVIAGLVGYVLAWGIAVAVWRQLAVAEIEDLRLRLIAAMEHEEAVARAAAQAGDGGRPPGA